VTIPLASALEALLSPRARHENDVSVLDALSFRRSAEPLPEGLALEWLGTAGFRLSYEGVDLLIDPYVSRHGLRQTLRRGPLLPSAEAIARHVPKADAVLVGHTHFDHALDVPKISEAYLCPVYGSTSIARLMALHGLGDRATVVRPGQVYSIGPFEVTFIESTHAKLILGLKVPAEGELSCDNLDELRGSTYRCGQVYGIHIAVAGVTFYHQGSADLLDDRIVHRGVDYFLMGIAGRGFTRDYTSRILTRLEPRVIIPHHFDDFFRPLRTEMGFSLNVNLGGFVEEVRRVSADFTVRTLTPLDRWSSEPVSDIVSIA
jgi:L-ascorbate metabolism protein UlaG (beta-lactamase superfamily)